MTTATALEALLVALLGIVLPIAAWASRRRFDEGRVPRGRPLFAQLLAQLLIVGGAATVVRLGTGSPVFAPAAWDVPIIAAMVGFLGIAVATMPWRWRRTSPKDRVRLARLLPRGREEAAPWILVCLAAGYAEELAYRGVLFAAILRWTGSAPLAALLAAAAFAAAHAVQGTRSVAVIFLLALGFQALAWWSGSLVPGMLVHAAYDMAAGYVYSRLATKKGGDLSAPAPADEAS